MFNLKNKYGQVFLKSDLVASKICELIPNNEKIIEIGFGDLFLTKHIIDTTNYTDLFLYEIDRNLFNKHYGFLSAVKNTRVFCKDFIDVLTSRQLSFNNRFVIVSNIAFNIFKKTITEIILNKYCNIYKMIILIPKDIGLSILKENCAFAKFVSFFYKSKIEFDVPLNSFVRYVPFKTCIIVMSIRDNLVNLDLNSLYKFIKFLFKTKRKLLKLKSVNLCLRPHELSRYLILKLYKKYKYEFNREDI